MLVWLSIAAAAVVVFLCWNLYRRFGVDRVEKFINGRRATSRMVSAAEFVDGSRHLQVALAVTNSDLFYENADMQASLDLRFIREIEYDVRLGTGHSVAGAKVLRLRSASQVFEFVIADACVTRWQTALPPRGRNESLPAADLAMRPASAI
jgi:hypothetical protein